MFLPTILTIDFGNLVVSRTTLQNVSLQTNVFVVICTHDRYRFFPAVLLKISVDVKYFIPIVKVLMGFFVVQSCLVLNV